MSTLPDSSSYAGPRNGKVPMARVSAHDSSIPMAPAAMVITSASSRNCQRMCFFLAPSARLPHHHARVLRVPQISRRAVGDEGRLVVAVEIAAIRELAVHGPNDREQ